MPQYSGVWNLAQQAQALTRQQWVTDPLFDYTTALLQADNAANGAQNNTFLDSSTNSISITRAGGNPGMSQGTFSPFSLQAGAWSNYFDGSGDYLTAPSSAAFGPGTGDFTIEFWLYATIFNDGSAVCQFGATGTNWEISAFSSNLSFWRSGVAAYSFGANPTVNAWDHFAMSRSGNTLYFYKNGVRTNSLAFTSDIGATNAFAIGVATSNNKHTTGYISNFRYIKGTALYTGTTLTVPSAPLTAINNTALLTCQSNRFIDNSTNAFTLTPNGNVAVQAFPLFTPQYQYTPAVTGGSGYFDGTGDYLYTAVNSALDFGTGAFTVEAWFYPSDTTSDGIVATSNNTAWGCVWIWTFGTEVRLRATASTSGADLAIGGGTFQVNAWNHVAAVRSGNDFSLYLNGSRVATGTSTTALKTGCNAAIGCLYDSSYNGLFNGYISSVRIVKGGALYSGTTYTVPTAPFTTTVSAGTVSLLANFTNAGILDGTMQNNWETVGTTQINTSVVKYGSGSMSFPGTANNFIQCPGTNVQFAMSTGDWTLEAWVYPTTSGTSRSLFDTQAVGGASACIRMRINSSNALSYFVTSSEVASGGVIPANTWTHVAICRANSITRLFVNGVVVSSIADTNTYTCGTNRPIMGVDGYAPTTDLPFAGYIDELRVTKGVARYIRNFTPPQVALPRQ